MKFVFVALIFLYSCSAHGEKFVLIPHGKQICKATNFGSNERKKCFNLAKDFKGIDIIESLQIRSKLKGPPKIRAIPSTDILKWLSTINFNNEKINFIQHRYKSLKIQYLAANPRTVTRSYPEEYLPFVITIELQEDTKRSRKQTIFAEGHFTYPVDNVDYEEIQPPFDNLPFDTQINNYSDGILEKPENKNELLNKVIAPVLTNELFLKPLILTRTLLLREMINQLEKKQIQVKRKPSFRT